MTSDVHVLGIRHHGPGSARAVSVALDELRPDVVVVEGPPELGPVAPLAASDAMVPPVAALVYAPEQPSVAAFYPMASFSPEWVALRAAAAAGWELRFADLPAANRLAMPDDGGRRPAAAGEAGDVRSDPIAALAAAAGSDDPERWWEDAIEHRRHGTAVFDAVLDAMRAVRDAGDAGDAGDGGGPLLERRREAAMRRVVRAAARDGARVAVVCGAWHAPVLVPDAWPPAAADHELLRGMPRRRVAVTWVPWTSGRLAMASGYGAGVTSPAWYEHLHHRREDAVASWMVGAAGVLRAEGLDASPASVIDATRLADTLAVLRGRPLPGIGELLDATQTVLAGGSPVPVAVVRRRLVVGERIGTVPDDTPMVPLARDLAAVQRRLRLAPSATERILRLDLRSPLHLERSTLLHRLTLLGVRWGVPADAGRGRGTFRETWSVVWRPELSIAVVEASGAGTTVEAAATATAVQRADEAADLRELTGIVESALLAQLPVALRHAMGVLADTAARQHDTMRLMEAVEPLARLRRYGDVRRADAATVDTVLAGTVTRVAIGLPGASTALDDDGAAELERLVASVQRGIALLEDERLRSTWYGALAAVAGQRGVHGLVAGRAARLLLDAGRLAADDARRRLSLALSPAAGPEGAAWLEGFLAGDAALLLHDRELLGVVDGWLRDVTGDTFDAVLPLLRRTFATATPQERRAVGDHVRRLEVGAPAPDGDDAVDPDRAARPLPLLRLILGDAEAGDG